MGDNLMHWILREIYQVIVACGFFLTYTIAQIWTNLLEFHLVQK